MGYWVKLARVVFRALQRKFNGLAADLLLKHILQ